MRSVVGISLCLFAQLPCNAQQRPLPPVTRKLPGADPVMAVSYLDAGKSITLNLSQRNIKLSVPDQSATPSFRILHGKSTLAYPRLSAVQPIILKLPAKKDMLILKPMSPDTALYYKTVIINDGSISYSISARLRKGETDTIFLKQKPKS